MAGRGGVLMGAGRFTRFFWGTDGYKPLALLDMEKLHSVLNPRTPQGYRPPDEVHVDCPYELAEGDLPWFGASAGSTHPRAREPGSEWATMRDEVEPPATPEIAARFGRAWPEAVATAKRHWARIRAVLVDAGLPDPGEGELLARWDWD